ncbi:glyoxalase [Stenotrophomonas maltophilia]|uniref:glyoxalase n=1 Tax=Stenotrophomonas maltophilia TaxID=40324 RepID=UPI0015DE8B8C|nr:glyoxalase [Stenotrophomonas maltophilia]MBA0445983.1 glyoxalase [Stenotrophomonas maltophilia]
MLDHLGLTSADLARSKTFFLQALAPLQIGVVMEVTAEQTGAPGLRPWYHPDYYGAFVLDPDGNNIEAVCHRPTAGEAA